MGHLTPFCRCMGGLGFNGDRKATLCKMTFTMALVPHQDCDSGSLPSKDGCFHGDEVNWTPNAGDKR